MGKTTKPSQNQSQKTTAASKADGGKGGPSLRDRGTPLYWIRVYSKKRDRVVSVPIFTPPKGFTKGQWKQRMQARANTKGRAAAHGTTQAARVREAKSLRSAREAGDALRNNPESKAAARWVGARQGIERGDAWAARGATTPKAQGRGTPERQAAAKHYRDTRAQGGGKYELERHWVHGRIKKQIEDKKLSHDPLRRGLTKDQRIANIRARVKERFVAADQGARAMASTYERSRWAASRKTGKSYIESEAAPRTAAKYHALTKERDRLAGRVDKAERALPSNRRTDNPGTYTPQKIYDERTGSALRIVSLKNPPLPPVAKPSLKEQAAAHRASKGMTPDARTAAARQLMIARATDTPERLVRTKNAFRYAKDKGLIQHEYGKMMEAHEGFGTKHPMPTRTDVLYARYEGARSRRADRATLARLRKAYKQSPDGLRWMMP